MFQALDRRLCIIIIDTFTMENQSFKVTSFVLLNVAFACVVYTVCQFPGYDLSPIFTADLLLTIFL